METVEVSLGMNNQLNRFHLHNINMFTGWIKHWFPEFEFTWLGNEMRENLPKEMDFAQEASNSARAEQDFEGVRTSLYIRKHTRPATEQP